MANAVSVNIALGAVTTDFVTNIKAAQSTVAQFRDNFKTSFESLGGSAEKPRGAMNMLTRSLTVTKKEMRDLLAVGAPVPDELASRFMLLKTTVDTVNRSLGNQEPDRAYTQLNQRLTQTRQKIQDIVAGGGKISSTLRKEYAQLQAQAAKVNQAVNPAEPVRAFDQLNQKLTQTRQKIQDIAATGKQVSPALLDQYNQLKTKVEGVNQAFIAPKVLSFGDKLQALAPKLQSFGGNLSKYVTAPLALAGGLAFSEYANIEGNIRGFQAITGSLEGATAQFNQFKAVAKLPGLGLEEAQQAGLRMEALGYSTLKAKNYLMQFGNAVALGGKGKTEFDQILNQVTQMGSKSKVLAEDLKPIVNSSPVIAKALKNMFGTVDSEQISAKLKSVGKGPQDFLDMLVDRLSKVERVSGGPSNVMENFSDATKLASFEFGKAATPRPGGFNVTVSGEFVLRNDRLVAAVDRGRKNNKGFK